MTSQLTECQTPASLPKGRGKGPGGQMLALLLVYSYSKTS